MISVDRAEDLWAIDPDEFVAARTDLVRRLRSAGEKDLAKQVASLRRPPRTAWALNLLAQQHPEQVVAIREASDALAAAFDGDGSDIRSRQADYRGAVEHATATAIDLAGLSGEAMRARVRDTLLAASVDSEVDEQLRTATVTEDHAAPGFAAVPGGSVHKSSVHPSRSPAARSRPTRSVEQPAADPKRSKRSTVSGPSAAAGAPATQKPATQKPATRKPATREPAAENEAIDEVADRRALAAERKRKEKARLDADRLRRRAESLAAKADEAERRAVESRRDAEEAIAAADAAEAAVAGNDPGNHPRT